MVTINSEEFAKLVEQGVKGQANGFMLLCRRLVSKIRKTDEVLAAQLSQLLADVEVTRSSSRAATPVDNDSRRSLLVELFPVVLEEEPIWPSTIDTSLHQILREREAAGRLMEAGLHPIRSALLYGPPGVGKTLSAYWLAKKLHLPLLTLDLATVMSSFLGKTGNNIKSVIDYARGFPCVLLLDEFDSVAKRRDDDRDVGELKRLVTVILQAIDEWPSSSLLIAATNHHEMLDPAVWRRFDLNICFDSPDSSVTKKFLESHGTPSQVADRLAIYLNGESFSNLKQLVLSAKKASVLDNIDFSLALLDHVISMKRDGSNDNARDLDVLRLHLSGLSNRQIATQIGVSHPTISRILSTTIN